MKYSFQKISRMLSKIFLLVFIVAIVSFFLWANRPMEADQKHNWTKIKLHDIGIALRDFHSDTGRYPDPEEGLYLLYSGETRYLRSSAFRDAWGNEIIYRGTSRADQPFELYSKGPNEIDESELGDDVNYWNFKEK